MIGDGFPIQRSEFLRLTALLSIGIAAACERSGPEPVMVLAPLAPEAPSASAAPAAAAPVPYALLAVDAGAGGGENREQSDGAEGPDPVADPSCSNAAGTAQACLRVGPSCEGLADECRSLFGKGMDLRPRVAQRFAECFVKAHRPACRDKAMGACMREAALSACIEPRSVAQCRSVIKSCRAAGKEPSYTLEQCAKIVSAVLPSQDPSGWEKVDLERLGPSTAEGCSLRFVLPYQPWGPSWDGTFDAKKRRP